MRIKSQYKRDIFNKLDFPFKKGKKLLDVGCGDGSDGEIFEKKYGLDFYGVDIYKDENIRKLGLKFKKGGIYKIPYKSNSFDYVFLHDVMHHIDEPKKREERHLEGLSELRRVCKHGGYIIIVDANRYNPLFYPHMVKMEGHDHFVQSYFIKIVNKAFSKDKITFKFFEAHAYPKPLLNIFKLYEYIMEHFVPRQFRAYNVCIVNKNVTSYGN